MCFKTDMYVCLTSSRVCLTPNRVRQAETKGNEQLLFDEGIAASSLVYKHPLPLGNFNLPRTTIGL
jgi:hypothetical protein